MTLVTRVFLAGTAVAVCAVLPMACGDGPEPAADPDIDGLSREESGTAGELLRISSEAEFDRRVETIAKNGKPSSVLLLMQLMIDLPWDESMVAKGQERCMRKVRVEAVLDRLVASREHDQLSAAYFRGLTGEGDLAAARKEILEWTRRNIPRMVWDPQTERFAVPER